MERPPPGCAHPAIDIPAALRYSLTLPPDFPSMPIGVLLALACYSLYSIGDSITNPTMQSVWSAVRRPS